MTGNVVFVKPGLDLDTLKFLWLTSTIYVDRRG